MVVEKQSTPVESRDQAIVRLAAEAKQRGIQIFTYLPTNEWYATSHRNPDGLHRVTVLSCDCPGFFSHGRCMHHAALLDYIGELPELDPEPTPIRPLSTTRAYPIPSPEHLPAVLEARAELVRLEDLNDRGALKSTADFARLQNARARVHARSTNPRPAAIA